VAVDVFLVIGTCGRPLELLGPRDPADE